MRHLHMILLAGALLAPSIANSANSQDNITTRPFNNRSGPQGNTLFTKMAPERTGVMVVNSYDDPRMWNERYQEMVFGTIGTGIAIADYDSDGLPDLYVPVKTGGSRLYRNLGNWRFEDTTESAGVRPSPRGWSDKLKNIFGSDNAELAPWDQGAFFADVDNDGWLDLYVTSFNAPNRLYINQGDGTFTEEAEKRGLAIVDSSGVAAFCDYDLDGSLDLYIQTNILDAIAGPEGRPDLLLHNDGDGNFSDVSASSGMSGISAGHSATWWDYNNDNWPDLYVANDFSKPDKLYLNLHDGTFKDVIQETVPHMPYYSMGADLGDLNNDGLMDFFVADMAPSTHEKDQRGMAVSRARELGKGSNELTPQRMHNALYLNTGLERMREGAWMYGVARTDWTWSTRFEDLDNDGFLDLHVTNGMVREYHNADILNKVMGAVSRQSQRIVMRKSPVLKESNFAFRNRGGEEFEPIESDWGLGEMGVSFGAAFGDLDGDGDLDLVYANHDAQPTLLRNDSDQGHRTILELRGTTSNRFGVGAKIQIETSSGKQSRQLVLARGYLSSSEPALHFGLGQDELISRVNIQWPSGKLQSFENLPAGNRYIITERVSESATKTANPDSFPLFEKFGKIPELDKAGVSSKPSVTATQNLSPFTFPRKGASLATADLNGDGKVDLIQSDSNDHGVKLFEGNQSDSQSTFLLDSTLKMNASGPILIEDFNRDGNLDLLLTSASEGNSNTSPKATWLLLMNGDGDLESTSKTEVPNTPAHTGAAIAGDFDQDGWLDIFLGSRMAPGEYPRSGRSVLLRNTGRQFEDVTHNMLPDGGQIGLITGALCSDIDNDGWPDILVSSEWGQIRYYRNLKGKGFEDKSEEAGFTSAGAGLWTSLAQGDFNEDGRPDIIAGNIGLNTRYQATPDAPAVLYYGDFGGRGDLQIIQAYYEDGKLLPWRSLKELADVIPHLARRFPKTDAFAAATLEEVISPQDLANANKLEVTQLQSGVFLSQNDGTFEFQPFPRIAQIAPINCFGIADFDRDGHLDLAAAQNLYGVDPTVGRFDGGLGQILLGDGRGGFMPLEPADSGFVVVGEGIDLEVVDFDGDGYDDIITTRTGSSSLLFRNRSAEKIDQPNSTSILKP